MAPGIHLFSTNMVTPIPMKKMISTSRKNRFIRGISTTRFLFVIFTAGTLLLLPGFIYEIIAAPAVQWDVNLILIILYLGLGTSVISFLCWNAAISRLGAARTALFGNLIPIFASLEAVFFLGEKISMLHLISGVVVITGLIIANLRKS